MHHLINVLFLKNQSFIIKKRAIIKKRPTIKKTSNPMSQIKPANLTNDTV